MSDIEDLMQPGGTHWEDDALCKGDDRFLHPLKTEGLGKICGKCPVFMECYGWAKGKDGVFAAGKWRSLKEEDIEPWHGKASGSGA